VRRVRRGVPSGRARPGRARPRRQGHDRGHRAHGDREEQRRGAGPGQR